MKKSLYFILCFAFLSVLHAMDEEIVVTSSLGGATLAEIDSPVFVIKGDDINYSASTNLGESLNYLLGVNSSNFGPGVGQPVIRGMGGTRVRILSNGKLVRDVSGLGSDHLNDVDMNDLQQIEVVRGPSSLLYSNGTIGGRFPVFNDKAGNTGVLHHVGIVHLVHGGHAAAGVAVFEVSLQQGELFLRRPRAAFGHHQICIGLQRPLLRARRLEIVNRHAHRNARLAVFAAGAIGHRLAAAKADPVKRIVQLFRMRTLQLGEHLALRPARQVQARRRARHEEAGEANGGRHVARQVLKVLVQ